MSLGVASGFRHATVPPQDAPKIPLPAVAGPPRIFEGPLIDRDGCKADAHDIIWMPYPSTIWFTADTIWHPEIARTLSPRILADLSFERLPDG
jgi:hypothetical protein